MPAKDPIAAQRATIPTNRVRRARIAVTAISAHTDHVSPLIECTVSLSARTRSSNRGSSAAAGAAAGVVAAEGLTRVRVACDGSAACRAGAAAEAGATAEEVADGGGVAPVAEARLVGLVLAVLDDVGVSSMSSPSLGCPNRI